MDNFKKWKLEKELYLFLENHGNAFEGFCLECPILNFFLWPLVIVWWTFRYLLYSVAHLILKTPRDDEELASKIYDYEHSLFPRDDD
jgi:hypothetical protein